jgi:hypothetical protein
METKVERSKWYCMGQYYDKKGKPCEFSKGKTFKYIPMLRNNTENLRKQDWIFDTKSKCQKKCDILNRDLQNRMKKHGYTDFKKYLFSRAHEEDTMLTVKDLIKYLKTQDQDALVVGYEFNSCAYTSQSKNIPNCCIRTVKEDKEREMEYLKQQYPKLNKKAIKKKFSIRLKENYRYVQDNDIIINF